MRLSEILNAIGGLPRAERLRLVAQVELDLAQENFADMSYEDDLLLERRGRLLVYTGPADASTLDHRAARAERIYRLMTRSRAGRG